MPEVTIFHNPGCSKSRGAMALLAERGIRPEVVLYLEQPPSLQTLVALLERLDGAPAELVRRSEAAFVEAGLELAEDADATQVAALLAEHPALMQRPVVVVGDRAVIARPPQRLLELL
jgi:arsenate reductase (glutaredoxin)